MLYSIKSEIKNCFNPSDIFVLIGFVLWNRLSGYKSRGMLKISTTIFMILSVLLGFSVSSYADFYKYRDAAGNYCITDNLNNVPPQFRSRVKIIKDGNASSTPVSSIATSETPLISKDVVSALPELKHDGWLTRQLPMLKVITIILGFFFAALLLCRLIGLLLPNLVGKVISIAIGIAVVVFIFKTYSERVAEAFTKLKTETNNVQKAVDKNAERIQKQADQ